MMVFKENEVEFQVLPLPLKKNMEETWFSLGTNLLEYSVPEASDQRAAAVVTKQGHVYRAQCHLYICMVFKIFLST